MVFDRIDRGLKPWHVLAFVVVALALGAIVGLVTGPHLQDLADGLNTFELRFNGYTNAEAVELLAAYGQEGRSYYSGSHLIADTFFAPFLFLAITSLFLFLTRPGQRFSVPLNEGVRLVVVALAVCALGADLLENIFLWITLGGAPEPPAAAVAAASIFTGIKWLGYAGAFAALVATVIIAVIRGVSGGEPARA